MAIVDDLFTDFLAIYAQSRSFVEKYYTVEKIEDKIVIQIENTATNKCSLESLSLQQHVLNLIGEIPLKFSYQITFDEVSTIDYFSIIILQNDYHKINNYLKKKMH